MWKAIFGGGGGGSSNNGNDGSRRRRPGKPRRKKSPPPHVDLNKAEIPKRWRPGISAADAEFRERWEWFAAMRRGDRVERLKDVLERHFDAHEAALFLPAGRAKHGALALLQRQNARRFDALVASPRFRGLPLATPEHALASKLTMMYFGLPVAPHSFLSIGVESALGAAAAVDSDDEIVYDEPGQLVHPDRRPLRFLNKYAARTHGKDLPRVSDENCEDYYRGISELQWSGNISFNSAPHVSVQSQAASSSALRGGAGSLAELGGSQSSQPTGRWRLYGRQGQIVFGSLEEFGSAVDRLLGFMTRGGHQATLSRFDKQKQRLDKSRMFSTDTDEERGVYELIAGEPDPSETKFDYYVATPGNMAPGIGEWYPAANTRDVVQVLVDGQPEGNCAYIYLPFFARQQPIGANEYTQIFATIARILFAPLVRVPDVPAVLHSVVGLSLSQGDSRDRPLNSSLGGLNVPRSFIHKLQELALMKKPRDIFMYRGPSYWNGDCGIFMPGLTFSDDPVPDETAVKSRPTGEFQLQRYSCPAEVDGGAAAACLRSYIATRLKPAEIKVMHHIDVWIPGEAVLNPRAKPLKLGLSTANALNYCLRYMHQKRGGKSALLFFSARPVYEMHKALLAREPGELPDPEAVTGNDPQCFLFDSDTSVKEFRENVKLSAARPQDKDETGAILITQDMFLRKTYDMLPDDEKMLVQRAADLGKMKPSQYEGELAAMMRAGRNEYVIQPDTTEEEWILIKRFLTAQVVFVSRIPAWSRQDLQQEPLFGYLPPAKIDKGKGVANVRDVEKDENLVDSDHQAGKSGDAKSVAATQLVSSSADNDDGHVQHVGNVRLSHGDSQRGAAETASSGSASKLEKKPATRPAGNPSARKKSAISKKPDTSSKPPVFQSKWPITDSERIRFLREYTYGQPISIYDGGKPHVPINAPPVEGFLHGGPGLPSISLGMLTLTEQRRLQREYVHMRNLVLDRAILCPYRATCDISFAANDRQGFRDHIEECHATEKCNFCDHRLYKYWTAEQRRKHLIGHFPSFMSDCGNVVCSFCPGCAKALGNVQEEEAVVHLKECLEKAQKGKSTPGPAASKKTARKPAKSQPKDKSRAKTTKNVSFSTATATKKPTDKSTDESAAKSAAKKGTPMRKRRVAKDSVEEETEEDPDGDYEDGSQEESEDEYEYLSEDEDFGIIASIASEPATAKKAEASITLVAESTPASAAKKRKISRKRAEKDSTYRDNGDADDSDYEVAIQTAPARMQPASIASVATGLLGKKRKRKRYSYGEKGDRLYRPDGDYSTDDSEYGYGGSPISSVATKDREDMIAPMKDTWENDYPTSSDRRRDKNRSKGADDPTWRPLKGAADDDDDDDAALEASAVTEGEDSILATKKRAGPEDPSYRPPKDGDEDEADSE